MAKQQQSLLEEYKQNAKLLIKNAKKSGLSDEKIQKLFEKSFENIRVKKGNNVRRNAFKICFSLLLLFIIILYILLNVHRPTSSIVLRNVQGLTYPALKIMRTLTVPIIKLFPSLTDLYDESCLVENPHFYLSDLDCSPCETVHSVIDLTGIDGVDVYDKVSEGTPFVLRTNQKPVTFKDLKQLYENHSSDLSSHSTRLSNNVNINFVGELFASTEENLSSNAHILWRINKMTTARFIRKLFPKPSFFPDRTGQAVERFLFIDGPISEPYPLPNTECSYVFLIQGSGERSVVLKPASECTKRCKILSVHMKPSDILLYNWWYWRPVSVPEGINNNLSISYMNSYC